MRRNAANAARDAFTAQLRARTVSAHELAESRTHQLESTQLAPIGVRSQLDVLNATTQMGRRARSEARPLRLLLAGLRLKSAAARLADDDMAQSMLCLPCGAITVRNTALTETARGARIRR